MLTIFVACSTQKNTAVTRAYHSVNTRYNVHFNANEAYNQAIKDKIEGRNENLSEMLYIYPLADKEELDKYMTNSEEEAKNDKRDDIVTETKKDKPRRSPSLSARREAAANPRKARREEQEEQQRIYKQNTSPEYQPTQGPFGVTIDKCTKAIRQHSIKVKPKRDPSRRDDKEYQNWVGLNEFNPFLHNTWLLLGKAELQNGDYLQAASTFSYASKIYSTDAEMVAECRLWTALTYSEMGWLYEAENMMRKVDQNGGVSDKLKGLYSSIYANIYTRSNRYKESVPYLEYAISTEKNKTQRRRMQYMLGQVYTLLGEYDKAYAAYDRIPGLTTPYEFEFNARIRQMELPGMDKENKMLGKLEKMARQSKNKDYLDQIYSAIGYNYIQHGDTLKAIANYQKAIKSSTRNGYDKALAQIALGDIYFNRHQFIEAQPCYAAALPSLSKENKDYERVSFRSGVLNELVVHAKVVHEQDSLQYVARLPEQERMRLIKNKIENLKKQEEESRKDTPFEQQNQQKNEAPFSGWNNQSNESLFGNDNRSNIQQSFSGSFGVNANKGSFYFYDKETVAQGKIAFQRQWGMRKLEDDWRRSIKTVPLFDNELLAENDSQKQTPTQSSENDTIKTKKSDAGKQNQTENDIIKDIYSPEYYLQQLPLTAEAVKQSDALIENGLYNMGLIYKNSLVDYNLAISTFDADIKRFPQSPNLEDIYYQLFLIYMKTGNKSMTAYYRAKLIDNFSGRPIATALADPDYESNIKYMASRQEQLYEDTYDAYIKGDTALVRKNYKDISTKYPFSDLMPRFMMLDALTYVQAHDAEGLKSRLKSVAETYPKSEVTPIATDMLKHIVEGQIILSDGTPITGSFDWSMAFESEEDSLRAPDKKFAGNPENGYSLLFVFENGSTDRNQLLFDIADYNFSNYLVKTYDLGFDHAGNSDILQVRGFASFDEIKTYIDRAFDRKMVENLSPRVTMVPVANDDYILFVTRGLKAYIDFFETDFANTMPRLIAYWNHDKNVSDHIDNLLANQNDDKDHEQNTVIKETSPQNQSKQQVSTSAVKPSESLQIDKLVLKEEDSDNKQEVMTDEQKSLAKTVDAIADHADDLINNPVDGLKNILKDFRNRPKLSKEEKAAEKERKKAEKAENKRLQLIAKEHEDSIARHKKAENDSIRSIEKQLKNATKATERQRVEAQKQSERDKKDAAESLRKARIDEQKQRDAVRKEKIRQQKQRQQERQAERDERERIQRERRKQKAREPKVKAKLDERNSDEKGRRLRRR